MAVSNLRIEGKVGIGVRYWGVRGSQWDFGKNFGLWSVIVWGVWFWWGSRSRIVLLFRSVRYFSLEFDSFDFCLFSRVLSGD